MLRLKTTIYYYLTVFLLLTAGGRSEAHEGTFCRFTNTEILRDNTTLCALRDKYGFWWVGTSTGLKCFDGNDQSLFRNSVGALRATENSNINIIYEYGDDIWFGGSSGLYVFHRKDNTFATLPYKTKYGVQISSMVQKIITAGNGLIWICTYGQGLFILNTADGTLVQDSRHGIFFSDMVTGSDGLVYTVALDGNIRAFHPDGRFVYQCNLPDYVVDKNKICMASTGTDIWMSSNTRLYRLDTRSREVVREAGVSVPYTINTLLARERGMVLMGTDDGIWQYDSNTGRITRLDPPNANGHGLYDHTVSNLYWDSDGSLIVVTPMGGISFMSWQSGAFDFVPLPSAADGSLNFVRMLCPSSDANIVWAGSDHGLVSYNVATQSLRPVPMHGGNDEIMSLTTDGNLLWIGLRHQGLRLLDKRTGEMKSYTYDRSRPYTLMSNDVNAVYRTRHGEIMVLTNWGLCQFDEKKEHFMSFSYLSQQLSFICMAEDKQGRLWASVENKGLFMRQNPDAMFVPVQSRAIGTSTVTMMRLDSRGTLWAAALGGGVFYCNGKDTSFHVLDVAAVRGQSVYFMEEDTLGFLWIGLRDGIIRVDTRTSSFNSRFYTYDHYADFQPVMRSSCRLANGKILFGSSNGFFVFDPQRMKSNDNLVKVYIQSLSFPYLENSDAEIDRLGLNVPLYMQEEIELPYSNNSFTLHFSSSRYGNMPAVRYNYMLRGVDQTWIRGAVSPEATYTNLSPGTYEFLLSHGAGKDAKVSSLRIVILPPWYRTVWAYLVYIVIVLLVGWYIFLRSRRVIRQRYDKRLQEYRRKKEHETFQAKIRFFVDLVHEIRTPLTLISLPLEKMADDIESRGTLDASESHEHIQSMRRNMGYLLGITNQLLDFQKAESNGEIKLHLTYCNVKEALMNIYRQFEHPMSVSGKELTLNLPDADVSTMLDIDKTDKVLMNLIGNAVKYSRRHISVTLGAPSADGRFTISVADDGPGVPVKERERIFDMYYQIGNDDVAASLGTGLGLAYAKLLATSHGGDLTVGDSESGGALFEFTLPVRHSKASAANGLPDIAAAEVIGEADTEKVADTRNFTILLVEDNEELLRMTAEALGKWYKVKKACDGKDALSVLQYHDIDMVISDVMMPRMDGVELCRRMKTDINYSHIPVILLTAKTSREAKVEGLENGADVYIEKPFTIKQLHYQIVNLLRLRQQFYERMRSISNVDKPEQATGELGMNKQDMDFLQKMHKYMSENISDEDFSIDTLAERLNMSRSSYYRKIKALTGMTPVDYMKNARLDHAARLLSEGGKVTEVASMVGFTSSSYFAKCFKAKFGVVPKDYATSKTD